MSADAQDGWKPAQSIDSLDPEKAINHGEHGGHGDNPCLVDFADIGCQMKTATGAPLFFAVFTVPAVVQLPLFIRH